MITTYEVWKVSTKIRVLNVKAQLRTGCTISNSKNHRELVESCKTLRAAQNALKKYDTDISIHFDDYGISYAHVTEFWIVEVIYRYYKQENQKIKHTYLENTPFPLLWRSGHKIDKAAVMSIRSIYKKLHLFAYSTEDIQRDIFHGFLTLEIGEDDNIYLMYQEDYSKETAICKIGSRQIITNKKLIKKLMYPKGTNQ